MKKLTDCQRKLLADFFNNSAVAWLTVGIVAPFFLPNSIFEFLFAGIWGLIFTFLCLLVAQLIIKGVRE